MVLNIPVNEAVELIKDKANKPISLRTVCANTINVGCEVNVKIPIFGHISKTVSIDIIIDKVVDTDVHLRYSTGMDTGDNVIKALLSYFLTASDIKVVGRDVDGHIAVHLKEVKEMDFYTPEEFLKFIDKARINAETSEKNVLLYWCIYVFFCTAYYFCNC